MHLTLITLLQIGKYIFFILIPILILYLTYLFLTKAFRYMGFSSFEALLIVFVSIISGFDLFIYGVNLSNIHLFEYNTWRVGINFGGALIPIILSIYLIIRKKIHIKKVVLGILVVTVITFLVTQPVPSKGIVSYYPYFLLPAISASISSIFLLWKDFKKAAPLAYISGSLGVLVGADFLHLPELLSHQNYQVTNAVIGGANVFDMIFITGILAVILDGVIMFRQRAKRGIN